MPLKCPFCGGDEEPDFSDDGFAHMVDCPVVLAMLKKKERAGNDGSPVLSETQRRVAKD